MRPSLAAALLVASGLAAMPSWAWAQKPVRRMTRQQQDPLTGTFAATGITMSLHRTADGYAGTVRFEGEQYRVTARRDGERLRGTLVGGEGRYAFEAHMQGNSLVVWSEGQQYVLQRIEAPSATTGAAPLSGRDRELAELLLSSHWCSFSFRGRTDYNATIGISHGGRAVFRRDGQMAFVTDSESGYSFAEGAYATEAVAREHYYWRVANGSLLLSEDRAQWERIELDVRWNSNGAPILVADETEYARCS